MLTDMHVQAETNKHEVQVYFEKKSLVIYLKTYQFSFAGMRLLTPCYIYL